MRSSRSTERLKGVVECCEVFCSKGSYVPQVEDAERFRAVCSAIPTALNCTGDLVAGEQFRFL